MGRNKGLKITLLFAYFPKMLVLFTTAIIHTLQKLTPLTTGLIKADNVFKAFFLFYIKNRGESKLSPPSFGNVFWE